MKTLEQHLTQYAACHRDYRNIATHFVGIPLIVAAVAVLLSRPAFTLAGVTLSPALLAALVSIVYYLVLDIGFGLIMAALLGLAVTLGAWSAAQSTTLWLVIGLGAFSVGWVLQFVGHYYEGRKPAFVDDLMGLMIGPLFVLAELAFALGLRASLRRDIEAVVGPTRWSRDLPHSSAGARRHAR